MEMRRGNRFLCAMERELGRYTMFRFLCLKVKQGKHRVGVGFFTCTDGVKEYPITYPERILFTALNPKAGEIKGSFSVVRDCPLYRPFCSTSIRRLDRNFERMGNLRFAVTYNPQGQH